MNALKTCVFLMACCAFLQQLEAQSSAAVFSTSPITPSSSTHANSADQAVFFADSLFRAFHELHWNECLDLSYPGAVSFYGGAHSFTDHLILERSADNSTAVKLRLLQMERTRRELQCVIEKVSETVIDGTDADVISYVVGQSKDEGRSWKFLDVSWNTGDNLIYMMPDISVNLNIPGRQIVFQKDRLAKKN